MPLKVLLIDSAFPINVRNKKILTSLGKQEAVETKYCAWNRTAKEIEGDDANQFIFTKTSGYGKKLKKLLNIFSYAKFVGRQIKYYQPDVIIASHWDSLLMAACYKQKTQTLIYEILDIPTSANPIVRLLLRFLEILALNKVDKLIFASRFFAPIYQSFNGKTALIENKPYQIPSHHKAIHQGNRNKLKIAFLGTVRYAEILKNLVDASLKTDIEVEIWGDGPDEIALRAYAKGMEHVKFYGRYNYDNIAQIYANVDLVWAVYPSNDYNVKYAISNKYHECILYGKPGIFASGTELGNMVEGTKIGFIVNPYDVNDMMTLFNKVKENPLEVEQRRQNLMLNTEPRYWEDVEKKLVEIIVNN